jgi:Fe-S-cluster-containing hydrogenase component 2
MAGIIVRSDVCTGCMNCVEVCSLRKSNKQDRTASVIRVNLELFSGKHSHIYCRQCEKPECSKACSSLAIVRDRQSGAWKIDYALCIRCGSCVAACPFKAMIWYDHGPLKCDLCDSEPACIEACRFNAILPAGEAE